MHEWRKLTNDPHVLDIVAHCHLDINVADITHLFSEDITYGFSKEDSCIITQEVDKLLGLGVIKLTQRQEGQILSPVFLRQNKDGGFRMILNLEKLNRHIDYKHFKMENFEQAVRLVNRGDYMASVDLRHAYYSIRIAEEQQKLLCFRWQDKIYKFTCLPNGVSEGPRLFTKLMKPVFATLRQRGYTISSYIDDTILTHSSVEGCYETINSTLELLQQVGFCINVTKSIFVPTQRLEYLGNVIDSVSMTVTLPDRRREKIVQSCTRLFHRSRDTIRNVAKVIGYLVAAVPAVEMGKLHYRYLEMAKISALQRTGGNFDKWMDITSDMKTDLLWWIDNVAVQDRKIFRPGIDLEIYTDASNLGWGGCLNDQCVNGRWSATETELHINVKELKAILFTVKSFTHLIRGKHIKVFCDNATAVAYVNQMGGTKSPACNDICRDLWGWCTEYNVWLTCSHIPGSDNSMADAASRKFNDRHEWKLNVEIFQKLCNIFGVPIIDLFASRLNKQVPRFCSWHPDPEAEHFDAFSITWSQFPLVYIFPPFALIARCLQKMRAEMARGWFIVPFWPSQPWMGTLLKMLIREPRLIERRKDILRHPSSEDDHPVMRHTQLMACLLSGDTCEQEAFRKRVRTSSWPPGDRRQGNSTRHMSRDGYSFVTEGTSIPLLPA